MDTIQTFPSRFTRPIFLWAVAALVTQLAVDWLPKHVFHQPMPRLLTLVPLVPAMFFWATLVHMIQKADELQKRIWFESVFIAFMATMALTIVFAGLERVGIRRASGDDIGSSMMLLWGCAYVFCAWRYR